jgi:uncharacterized protein (DUF2062 family)
MARRSRLEAAHPGGHAPEDLAEHRRGKRHGLFPILGTTTTLCIIAGIALGLNQPIIQGVNALCTFIYFPLIYAFVRLGDTLARSGKSDLNIPVMISLATHHPRDFVHQFGVTALHAMLGWVGRGAVLDSPCLPRGPEAP